MLEPGIRILKCIGLLTLSGLLLYIFRYRSAAYCMWSVSGIAFVVLLVLLAIEVHQDKVMNDIVIKKTGKTESLMEY